VKKIDEMWRGANFAKPAQRRLLRDQVVGERSVQLIKLRVIAARLESDGHVTRRGTRYGSEAVARMLSLGAFA
jgi:hypothetical protein